MRGLKFIGATLVLAVLMASFSSIVNPSDQTAQALSGGDFQAGRIIDDGIFFNGNAMSANDIQNFLNAKVPNCDTNGSKIYSGSTTRAQHGQSRGNPPPYTCLKSFTQNTPSRSAENQLCNAYGGGTKSAAQIIHEVARVCGVNPQVLIVLLQKEQSLVTDEWPWNIQYRSATGFGCPDTAPCDAEYYGFFNQVYNGARIYKKYMRDAVNYNYRANRNNNILYNPNSSCGSSSTYIQNHATAGLYNYTPYRPNQAALNNLYGSGDGCSAYGNRNFWRMFHDWFGSTIVAYNAQNHSQTGNYNEGVGWSRTVHFTFKNNSGSTWYDDVHLPSGQGAVHLAVTAPINKNSPLAFNWPSANRPAKTFNKVFEADGTTLAADQHAAQPGQLVRFEFSVRVPEDFQLGTYRLDVQPVVEGTPYWNMGGISSIDVTAVRSYVSNQTICPSGTVALKQNEHHDTTMRFVNTGSSTWYDDHHRNSGYASVRLATANPMNMHSPINFFWPTPNRPAVTFSKVFEANGTTLASDQHRVQPGQIAEYNFRTYAHDRLAPGQYSQEFKLIVEGLPSWDMMGSCALRYSVQGVDHGASFYRQSAYPTIAKGQTGSGMVAFKNTGNSTWIDDTVRGATGLGAVHLATANPINANSPFAQGWPSANRPAKNFSKVYEADGTTLASDQHRVQPGQIAQYEFSFRNDTLNAGQRGRIYFTPVLEGTARWQMTGQQVWLEVIGG